MTVAKDSYSQSLWMKKAWRHLSALKAEPMKQTVASRLLSACGRHYKITDKTVEAMV